MPGKENKHFAHIVVFQILFPFTLRPVKFTLFVNVFYSSVLEKMPSDLWYQLYTISSDGVLCIDIVVYAIDMKNTSGHLLI